MLVVLFFRLNILLLLREELEKKFLAGPGTCQLLVFPPECKREHNEKIC
jgi:hypothetical protein